MRASAAALFLVLASTAGCPACSMSSGTLVSGYTPWEIVTQYAWWDSTLYERDNGVLVLKDRTPDQDGSILNIHLYGFNFTPWDDRRLWSAEQLRSFRQGEETEPFFWIVIRQAQLLDDGDEVVFDTEQTLNINRREPNVQVGYSPGNPPLNSSSEFPDEVTPLGSREIVKVKISKIEKQAGLGKTLSGTLEYERDRLNGDPDDVTTGKVTVNFTALVIGERLAECNEQTVHLTFGGGQNVSACDNLSAR